MPQLDTHTMTEQALTLIETGHLPQARALYEQICRYSPMNAEARMMLGALRGELGDTSGAIADLREALRLQPGSVEAHFLLGNLMRLQGNAAEALAHLQQVVTLNPDHAEAWVMLSGLHGQLGQADQAESCCRHALVLQPDSLDAHMNLANALLSQGKHQEAAENYQQVVAQQPVFPLAWFMLGQTYAQIGRHEEAIRCLRQSLSQNPGLAEAHIELGHALQSQDKTDEAHASYLQALRLDPNQPVAHYNLGMLLHKQRRFPEAEAKYREAIQLKPNYVEAYHNLGRLLASQGDSQGATGCFRQILNLNPHDTEASYLLSSLGETPAPPTAPPEFVAKLFDDYADHFDKHLIQQLEYRTPELMRHAVRQALGEAKQALNVLDLGCGTGLCGPLFRDLAARLTGIDLSAKMIDKARERLVYDELYVSDITAAMHAPGAAYDLIIAADVFVYIGDLAAIFDACRIALKPGGLFVFSVEAAEDTETYVLRSTCRYAHAIGYIRQLAQSTALQELGLDRVTLRKQEGQPILGHIFVLKQLVSE